jgi:hypothetical protein
MEPKAPFVFKPSSVREINSHTNHQFKDVEWLLVFDESNFHVYVVARLTKNLSIRIDWNTNTTLTFERYQKKKTETESVIGTSEMNFCKLCLQDDIVNRLREYNLFKFNCRTVSFLILIMMGFKTDGVWSHFERANMLCGLDETQCLSADEIHHFLQYEQSKGKCVIQ